MTGGPAPTRNTMVASLLRRRASLLPILALTAAAWFHPLGAQVTTVGGALRGQVVEDRTGAPVAHAFVEHMDGRTRIRASTTADEDGRFLLAALPTGPFRLRVSRLGYRGLTTPYWSVKEGEVLTIVVRMDPEVVPVAPLEVRARVRSASPVLESFYERMRRGQAGRFLDRETIAELHASRVTQVLETLPGVRLETAPGLARNDRIVTFGVRLGPGGGSCPVQVFVDGILASRAGPVSPDELASPGELIGVEVYRGLAGLPAEFVTPYARCGVVALWTRRGG